MQPYFVTILEYATEITCEYDVLFILLSSRIYSVLLVLHIAARL